MAIFNPNRTYDSDVWLMEGAAITFGTSVSNPTAMPNTYAGTIVAIGCTIQYQRPIQKRYPINVRKAIYLVGMPDGNIQFNMLFGPGVSLRSFIDNFNKVNESENSTILVTPFSTNNAASGAVSQGTWKITKPVLQSIGLNVQESGSADIQAVGTVTMQFTDMDIMDDDAEDKAAKDEKAKKAAAKK